jgi:hypothetical protein
MAKIPGLSRRPLHELVGFSHTASSDGLAREAKAAEKPLETGRIQNTCTKNFTSDSKA